MSATALPVPVPGSFSIPLAGYKQIYDCHVVEEALDELPDHGNETLRDTYRRMLKAGGHRFAVKPSALPIMDALYADLPNFSEVLDDIRRQLALCVSSADRLELSPMLLLGDPGIGKTHFARRVAELLGTGFGFIPMSSLTAGWILGGASSQWKNAKPGKVFETLMRGDYANPVMVVDEIDKAASDGTYDPLGAMYSLLEHDTARMFVDEFIEVPVDASDVVWVATANDARSIPEPILSRMTVYEIEAPDPEAARRIACTLYQELRSSHDWGRRFPEAPDEDVLDRLSSLSPRDMRKAVQKAFGSACLQGRSRLEADDVEPARAGRRPKIGF